MCVLGIALPAAVVLLDIFSADTDKFDSVQSGAQMATLLLTFYVAMIIVIFLPKEEEGNDAEKPIYRYISETEKEIATK